jgi:hypothetical protein
MPRTVVVDFSWPLIHAALASLFRLPTNLVEYLRYWYQYIENPSENRKPSEEQKRPEFFLCLCSSHLYHAWTKHKSLSGLKSISRRVIIQGLALLQKAESWEQAKVIFDDFCILTNTRRHSSTVKKIARRFLLQELDQNVNTVLKRGEIKKLLVDADKGDLFKDLMRDTGIDLTDHVLRNQLFDKLEVLDEIEQSNPDIEEIINQPNLLGSRKSIMRSSGFYIEFEKIFKSVRDRNVADTVDADLYHDSENSDDEDDFGDDGRNGTNPYFAPDFTKHILSKYCPIIPLWGSFFLRIHTGGQLARLTAGPVEQYNRSLKHDEFAHLPVSTTIFIEEHRKHVETLEKSWRVDLKLREMKEKPATDRRRGKGRPKKNTPYGVRDEKNAILLEQDNWGGQTGPYLRGRIRNTTKEQKVLPADDSSSKVPQSSKSTEKSSSTLEVVTAEDSSMSSKKKPTSKPSQKSKKVVEVVTIDDSNTSDRQKDVYVSLILK